MGSIYLAAEAGFNLILLVDGLFGNVPSVWHKEILYAQSVGAVIYGCSSMGALRAAEMHTLGMVGCGKIFRMYRSGLLTDDDEVCLIHAGPEWGYKPLSVPMINVRLTLRIMLKMGVISITNSSDVASYLKRIHFSERDLSTIKLAINEFTNNNSDETAEEFERLMIDQKHFDFKETLELASNFPVSLVPRDDWVDICTAKWTKQFRDEVHYIPSLLEW
jgi:hypothetical protein